MTADHDLPLAAIRTPFGPVACRRLETLTIAREPRQCRRLVDALTPPPPGHWTGLYLSYEGCCAVGDIRDVPAPDPRWGANGALWTAPLVSIDDCWLRPEADWRILTDEPLYTNRFDRLQQAIRDGELYQLNLTARASAGTATLQPAVGADAAPHAGILLLPDADLHVISQSPECLLELDGHGHAITRPIKGTCTTPKAFDALRASEKEQAEHTMVVDMARNDLGKVCVPGSITVDPSCAALHLPYATHMVSSVRGRPARGMVAGDILRALLPAASVTGTPKIRACQMIAALENAPRGPYTGILGAFLPDGCAFFSLLIRTAWRDRDGRWWYGTGGGIVADSKCSAEYRELILKLRPVTKTGP